MKQSAKHLNISENELLTYITQEAQVIPLRPEGFGVTIEEFKNYAGIGFRQAKKHLEQMVKDGKLKSQKMRDNRHISIVYYKEK